MTAQGRISRSWLVDRLLSPKTWLILTKLYQSNTLETSDNSIDGKLCVCESMCHRKLLLVVVRTWREALISAVIFDGSGSQVFPFPYIFRYHEKYWNN